MRHVPSWLDEAIDDLRADFEDAADPEIERQEVLARPCRIPIQAAVGV